MTCENGAECPGCPCADNGSKKNPGSRHIMLVGNPNCGKSSLFNRLCNMQVRTGNYPGVTVCSHIGNYSDSTQLIDLPGVYSLTCFTPEEQISVHELLHGDPELIINVVDSSCLERSLFLTLELRMLGVPMVMLLNMWDVAESRGIVIDTDKLSEIVGVPVIPVSATTGLGMENVNSLLTKSCSFDYKPCYIGEEQIAKALDNVAEKIPSEYSPYCLYYAKCLAIGDEVPSELENDAELHKSVKKFSEIVRCEPENTEESNKGVLSLYELFSQDHYNKISNILNQVLKKQSDSKKSPSQKIDSIILNKYLSFPIFLIVMFIVYFVSISWLGGYLTDWTNDTLFGETIIPSIQSFMENSNASEGIVSLVCDGIVTGVGAVLGFVPQMALLFLLLSILEECGYMTRASFVLDRFFQWVGLSGRSFIPFLIGSGCAVPALMTSRTLGSESERRVSLMTTFMVPCGAKLPVIITFASGLFPDMPLFAPVMYLIALFSIVLSCLILKKFSDFRPSSAPLLLELPSYHFPTLRVVIGTVWFRTKSFIKKAGTVIMFSVIAVWFLSSYSFHFDKYFFSKAETIDDSMLKTLSDPVSPIFAPMGFNDYRAVVPVISGLIAKENVLSTLAVTAGMSEDESDDEDEVDEQKVVETITTNVFAGDKVAVLSFLIFNLFTLPCFAAVSVIRKEMNNRKLFIFAIVYQMVLSYSLAVIAYNMIMWYLGTFSGFTIFAIVLLAVLIFMVLRKGATVSKADLIQFEKV